MHERDMLIVQTMAMIAENHGCHLTNVDICRDKNGERVGLIEIEGPEEKKRALAVAIDDVLKNFES
jgi:hypothetical protein